MIRALSAFLLLLMSLAAAPLAAEETTATAPSEALMTGEAWADYCDRMKAVGLAMLDERYPSGERERAEGFRHLARSLAMGLQWEVDFVDTDFPRFYRHDDEILQWGGPNVDNTYLRARISGDKTYRLRGNVSSIADLIISTRNGDMHQGKTGVAGDLDRSQLPIQADGSFEILLGPDVEPGEGIRTAPDTDQLGIRQYYTDWEQQTPAVFHIDRISDGPEVPADLTAAGMAKRLDGAAAWVEASIPYWNDWMARFTGASPANQVFPPRNVPGGSEDIYYGGLRWVLGEDEALLIEFEPPDARYWSFQWYTFGWFELPEYAHRQTTLNNGQARVDADGRVRIVVSTRDPGIENWIDTEGRESGSMTYRYIWSENAPVPTAQMVPIEALAKALPGDTPAFGPADRARQIDQRLEHIERRFRR
jgi:hypothetical protein